MSIADDIQFQETLKVVGAATGCLTVLYQILVLAFGPLLKNIVNPHRLGYLSLGVSIGMAGYTRLAWEAKSWSPGPVWGVLRPLLTEQPTAVGIVVSSFACLLGLMLIALVAYCWVMFPPDPSGYKRDSYPKVRLRHEIQKVLNTYTKFSGGLESAGVIVARLGSATPHDELPQLARTLLHTLNDRTAEPPYLVECVSAGEVKSTMRTEHGSTVGDSLDMRTAWLLSVLQDAHRQVAGLDAARRGELGDPESTFQVFQLGGIAVNLLHRPAEADGVYTILYGITLSRKEVKNRRFEEHFEMLREALLHIAPRGDLLVPTPPPPADAPPADDPAPATFTVSTIDPAPGEAAAVLVETVAAVPDAGLPSALPTVVEVPESPLPPESRSGDPAVLAPAGCP